MDMLDNGFQLFPVDETFNDSISPLYFKIDKDSTYWGLTVEKKHTNPMGICHGGVYMTLMDFALSSSICHSVKKFLGMPTISLNCDFFATAKIGDWIWADVETLRVTRTMGFASGVVKNADGETLMRASGNFKLPKDLEAAPGVSLDDVLAGNV